MTDHLTRKLQRQKRKAEREAQRSDPAHQQMRQEQKQRRWAIAKQFLSMGLQFVLAIFGNKIPLGRVNNLKKDSNILEPKQDQFMKSIVVINF